MEKTYFSPCISLYVAFINIIDLSVSSFLVALFITDFIWISLFFLIWYAELYRWAFEENTCSLQGIAYPWKTHRTYQVFSQGRTLSKGSLTWLWGHRLDGLMDNAKILIFGSWITACRSVGELVDERSVEWNWWIKGGLVDERRVVGCSAWRWGR